MAVTGAYDMLEKVRRIKMKVLYSSIYEKRSWIDRPAVWILKGPFVNQVQHTNYPVTRQGGDRILPVCSPEVLQPEGHVRRTRSFMARRHPGAKVGVGFSTGCSAGSCCPEFTASGGATAGDPSESSSQHSPDGQDKGNQLG